MPEAVVFAGPCLADLPACERERLCDGFELRPPARRGDLLAAVGEGARRLLLLDGTFFRTPAVTHKEILYALDAGTRVVGAASMGALRAAELAAFGMEGVGRIYRWFASGELDGDDEVAILHLSAEHGYRATTIALVEVRSALERLGWNGPDAAELVARLKELPFTDRSAHRVDEMAGEVLGPQAAGRLAAELARVSVKRDDACFALAFARGGGPAAAGRQPRRPPTTFLSLFKERYFRPGPQRPPFQAAWAAAQLLHPDTAAFVARERRRSLLAAAALALGVEPPAAAVGALARRFRQHLEATLDGGGLPALETDEAALNAARAEAATARAGGEEMALAELARRWGLSTETDPGAAAGLLEELVAAEFGLLPGWHLTRAFLATPALSPALAVAGAAAELATAFRRWARGARPSPRELTRLTADLWRCAESEVPRQAGRRGLFLTDGLTPGFAEAVAALLPAERLPRPVNAYPALRARLRETPLESVLDQPEPARNALASRRSGTSGLSSKTP